MKKNIINTFVAVLILTVSIPASAISLQEKNNQDTCITRLTEVEFSRLDESGLNGVYHLLFPSGKLQEIRIYDHGHLNGTWVQYNENEVMIALANYKNDKKHGKWIIWDDSGVKRYEMEYTEGNRSGTWYSWDENGTLVSERKY